MAAGIDNELKSIFAAEKKSDVLLRFDKELRQCNNRAQLIEALSKYTLFIYHKAELTTIRNRFTEFRNVIKEVQAARPYRSNLYAYGLEFFKAPDILNEHINNAYKAAVNEKNDNRLSTLPQIDFKAYRGFYDALVRDLAQLKTGDRERIYVLTILVIITSGRRFIEVLQKSTFIKTITYDKDGGNPTDMLTISGIAKQKSDKDKTVTAPVLFTDPETVVEWLRELRETFFEIQGMSESAINHKFSATFNKALRRLLTYHAPAQLQKNINTLHDLRAIYAESCHKLYNVQDGEEAQTKPRYFASILGHNENDEETQKSYIKFIVKA